MDLEKTCDFCSILRPIVYCNADTANLCLPCDSRVHSANALSSRHQRTLVCEACGSQLASVRCIDHRMLMCGGCNSSHHDLSSNHQRKPIGTYIGCPSADKFAELWGFDLNQLEYQSPSQEGFVAHLNRSSFTSGSSSVSEVTSTEVVTLPTVGSHGQYFKPPDQQDSEGHILQQILYLKKIQEDCRSGDSSLVRSQQETDVSSFKHNAKQMPHEILDQQLQHSLDLDSDLHGLESPYVEPISDSYQMALSQMEGDSFWQCKSPLQSGQLWTQNMQDLGVCDDPAFPDDFSMLDVDPTFKNIEEIFGGDQELDRALIDEAAACSSREMEMSIEKSDHSHERCVEDVSAASSTYMSYSANLENPADSSEKLNQFAKSSDPENSNVDAKQRALMRFREKKKSRMSEKQTRHTDRKARSELKKLVKGN